jgi:Tol biopolymer transport system component
LTISPYAFICVRDGHVAWSNSSNEKLRRWRPRPALSHDGMRVAFVSDGEIRIHDTATGSERDLVAVPDDPGEISWSWDDSEIAFFDHGISAVSVNNGVRRVLLTDSARGHPGSMQWLHNGTDLVIEVGALFVVSDGRMRRIDTGRQPAVSPSSDRIAYYAPEGVVAIDSEGTARSVLCKTRRSPLGKEERSGEIVWSPEGGRLLFVETVSEDERVDLHLLHLKSHRDEKFLSHTTVRIRSWQ